MSTSSPHPVLVAIDGPAGAGKSTVARALARRLGLPYLDTGAMYRAVALLARRRDLRPPFDEQAVAELERIARESEIEVVGGRDGARVLVDGEDVSDEVRSPECSEMSSAVSAVPEVRRALVALQRRAASAGGVMEGRDIGSVVLPEADLKVFLTAAPEERARRRLEELRARGLETTFEEVVAEQRRRDRRDASRTDSPLQVPRGGVVVDTTGVPAEQVVAHLLELVGEKAAERLTEPGKTP